MSPPQTLVRRSKRLASLRRPDVIALWWAHRALRTARHDLAKDGTRARVIAAPPGLPRSTIRAVSAYLRLSKATCLERSLIVQRWLADQGELVPVVIGVGNTDRAFAAHAWLPGYDDPSSFLGYTEISRIEPDSTR